MRRPAWMRRLAGCGAGAGLAGENDGFRADRQGSRSRPVRRLPRASPRSRARSLPRFARQELYELVKKISGRATLDILAESLPAAILGNQWPKTMYWTDRSGPRFIRPIRWLVALLGDQVIPFGIGGVRSGNATRGHRILGASSIPVTIATYESELRKKFVTGRPRAASQDRERRRSARGEARRRSGRDANVHNRVPHGDQGRFRSGLPGTACGSAHHRDAASSEVFSVEDAIGLAPNFVAVMNTSGDPDGLVKHGNERVLKARFDDARFFWNVDQARRLADRVDDLAKVPSRPGSDRINRSRSGCCVGQRARRECGCSARGAALQRRPDDGDGQGVHRFARRRRRALRQGQASPRPFLVRFTSCQPLSMDDSIPSTREGQIIGLADKLDSLPGCFGVGLIPSGSKDPVRICGAPRGSVQILVEARLDYKLERFLRRRSCTGSCWSACSITSARFAASSTTK